MFWGQWVAVLVREEGEGKGGIMFPAGHTQVNSSLASPDYTGPGLGLREAALPPPQGQPDSHQVISFLSRAGPVILPETRLSVVSHCRGLDGAGSSS